MTPVLARSAPSGIDTAPGAVAGVPAWFAERRRAAWQRFLETPDPARGDESWRFSDLGQLDFSGFTCGRGGTAAALPGDADRRALVEP